MACLEILHILGCIFLLIFHFAKGPGLTLLEIGADIYNTAHFSDPCLFPTLNSDSLNLDDECVLVDNTDNNRLQNLTFVNYIENHGGRCLEVIESSYRKNETSFQVIKSSNGSTTCWSLLKNDPTWATLSGILIFLPGWILAIYLALSYKTWWKTDRIETLTVIICGLFGFPIVLVILQLWAWIWNHKKKDEDFLSDFLPTIMGIEAFGDAAPQAVLNGFVIASKYPLGRAQLATLCISLVSTTLKILEYDFIPEMDDKEDIGPTKSVLSYLTMNKKLWEDKKKWALFWLRFIVLFHFYLLCNVARSASLCCILLYSRYVGILPVLISVALVTYIIRILHEGDWASCFMFSITNLFICSNGGSDDIRETTFNLMASTTKVCMGVFVTFQIGSMYLAYAMKDKPFEVLRRYSEYIALGEFDKAHAGWFCAWVIFLNVIHFILLHVIKDWLPKTEWELTRDEKTITQDDQMIQQGEVYIQRSKTRRGSKRGRDLACLEKQLATINQTKGKIEEQIRIEKRKNTISVSKSPKNKPITGEEDTSFIDISPTEGNVDQRLHDNDEE